MKALDLVNLCIVFCIFYVVFLIVVTPRPVEEFSTIYALSDTGMFEDYQKELPVNYKYPLTVGIINNLKRKENFTAELIYENKSENNTFTLEDNSSVEFIQMLSPGREGLNRFDILLYENTTYTNSSLRFFINGSDFFILNSTEGLKNIPKSWPLFFNFSFGLSIYNKFENERKFDLFYRYVYNGSDYNEIPFEEQATLNLGPKESIFLPISKEITKEQETKMFFMLKSGDYNKTAVLDLYGKFFYILNSTHGIEFPKKMPAGTNISFIARFVNRLYKPDYLPVTAFVKFKRSSSTNLTDESMSLLSTEKRTVPYYEMEEIPFSARVEEGVNNFIFEFGRETSQGHLLRETIFINGTV